MTAHVPSRAERMEAAYDGWEPDPACQGGKHARSPGLPLGATCPACALDRLRAIDLAALNPRTVAHFLNCLSHDGQPCTCRRTVDDMPREDNP